MEAFNDLLGRGLIIFAISIGILWHFWKKIAANNPQTTKVAGTVGMTVFKRVFGKWL